MSQANRNAVGFRNTSIGAVINYQLRDCAPTRIHAVWPEGSLSRVNQMLLIDSVVRARNGDVAHYKLREYLVTAQRQAMIANAVKRYRDKHPEMFEAPDVEFVRDGVAVYPTAT